MVWILVSEKANQLTCGICPYMYYDERTEWYTCKRLKRPVNACVWDKKRHDKCPIQATDTTPILAADVDKVRHGQWIEQPPDFDLCGVAYYQCSECGKEQQTPAHYCQFCGARMEGWKWCVWQDEDNEGVYCTAHIHEDRVLNCPYKDLEERQRADYPCQDYRPMDGWQYDV